MYFQLSGSAVKLMTGIIFCLLPFLSARAEDSDSGAVQDEILQILNVTNVDSISVQNIGVKDAKRSTSQPSSDTSLDKLCLVHAATANGGHMTTRLYFMPSKNEDAVRINDKNGNYSNNLNKRFVVDGYLTTRKKGFMKADFPDLILTTDGGLESLQVCKGRGCTVEAGTKTPFGGHLPGFGHSSTINDAQIMNNFRSMIKKFTGACRDKLAEQESPENKAMDLYTKPTNSQATSTTSGTAAPTK